MRRVKLLALVGLLLAMGILTACGGGGGGGTTGSNNWNEMVWNQDTWGPTAP